MNKFTEKFNFVSKTAAVLIAACILISVFIPLSHVRGVSVDLDIGKSVNKTQALPGDTIVYTIKYKNNGPDIAHNVVIRDPFINLNQHYLTFVSATPAPDPGTTDTWTIGTLNPDWIIRQITITAKISDSMPIGTTEIKDRANIDSTETPVGSSPFNYSNYVSTWVNNEPIQEPNLIINKSVNKTTPSAGETITYTIDYKNIGDGPATGIVIQDKFNYINQQYLSFVSATPAPDPGTTDTWNIGTLVTGQSDQISIRAKISDSMPLGTTEIKNRASIDSNETQFQYSNCANVFVTVTGTASISITKSVDKTSASPGDTITYTLNYKNTGSATATNVIVKDPFNNLNQQYLSFVSATPLPTSGNDTWAIGSLSAGQTGQISIRAKISSSILIPATGFLEIKNRANIDSSETSPGYSNYVSTWISGDVSLSIEKSVRNISKNSSFSDYISADPLDEVEFYLKIHSTGNSVVNNAKVWDSLPSRLNYISGSTKVDGVSKADGIITSNGIYIGDLAPGQTRDVKFRAKLESETIFNVGTTSLTNYGYVNTSGLSAVNDTAVVNVYKESHCSPSLRINKMLRNITRGYTYWTDTVYANPGDEIEVSVKINSVGNETATNTKVRDKLPPKLDYISGSTTIDGSYKSDGIISSTGIYIGSMYVNDIKEIKFRAKVVSEGNFTSSLTTLTNYAYAWADDACEVNDYAYVKVEKGTPQTNYALSISKLGYNLSKGQVNWLDSFSADPGQELEFSIQITNIGNTNLTNVKTWDTLPANLSIISGSTTIDDVSWGGDVTGAGLDLGTLGQGQAKTIKFRARVASKENFGAGSTTLINTAYTKADNVSQISDQASIIVTKSGEVKGEEFPPTGANLIGLIFLTIISALIALFIYCRVRENKLLEILNSDKTSKLRKAFARFYFRMKFFFTLKGLRYKKVYW